MMIPCGPLMSPPGSTPVCSTWSTLALVSKPDHGNLVGSFAHQVYEVILVRRKSLCQTPQHQQPRHHQPTTLHPCQRNHGRPGAVVEPLNVGLPNFTIQRPEL